MSDYRVEQGVVTPANLNFLDALTATPTEVNVLAGVTPGTSAAGKAVVLDSNSKISALDVTTLTINGASLDSTVALQAEIDAVTDKIPGVAGTVEASKILQAGATKNLDTLDLAELKIGGTAVTATAAELNKLDGAPLDATIGIGVEGGNAIAVTIQLKDGAGADLAVRGVVGAYLSDDAAGDSLTATAPSGGVAIGTDGLAIPVTPALTNALMVDGNLAIDAVAEKFKTTQTAAFLVNGIGRTKAATTALTFSAAHTITALKFGCVLVQINAAGTISTKVVGSPQAYDDAPTALAALPAVDAGNVSLGYIAIANNAGDWVANTDDLTNASDVTTAAFNDTAEVAIGGPKMWSFTSEVDGDIDVTITEAGVGTWYLVLVLADGKLKPSGAITFA